MYSLRRLNAFIAFAELENFTKAARAVHLSQPALFAQIGKFEQELGVSLYERHGRNVTLTQAGKRTLAFAREMRDRIEAYQAEVRGEEVDAAVVLCAGRGSYLYLLGRAIRRFRRKDRWPLSTLVHGRDDTVKAVASGIAHVGVTAALDDTPSHLQATTLCSVSAHVAVPADHSLASKAKVKLRDLAGVPLIAAPRHRGQRQRLEAAMSAAGGHCNVVIEADGWDLMLHFVQLGLGIAIVNEGCRPPRGVTLKRLSGLADIDYVMLTRKNQIHPGVAQLVDAIVDTVDIGGRR